MFRVSGPSSNQQAKVQRQSKMSLRIQKRGQRIDTKSAFFVSVHYVLRLRLSREAQIVRAVHAVA